MLAAILILSFLSACGFYAYVFVKLNREYRRLKADKSRLPERLYQMKPESGGRDPQGSGVAARPSFGGSTSGNTKTVDTWDTARRETVTQIGITLGGLAALFAGIMLFNSLVTWLHWN
jgi:hypothetical protein